jgi:hypothetical protein
MPASRSRSSSLDKEAVLPALLPLAAPTLKGLGAMLYALWALKAGKDVVTKDAPGAVRSLSRGEFGQAGGHALRGGLNLAMAGFGLGSLKTMGNLPNMYRLAYARRAPGVQAAAGKAIAANAVSLNQAIDHVIKRPQGMFSPPAQAGMTDLERASNIQRSMDRFNQAFDKNTFARIPGYERFTKTPGPARTAYRLAHSMPGMMAAGALSERMAPTHGSMLGGAAHGGAAAAGGRAYGPGSQMRGSDAAEAFMMGLARPQERMNQEYGQA